MPCDTVLALSGGLDSVVAAHQLAREGVPFKAIATHFGAQNSDREILSARYFASSLNIPLEILDIKGVGSLVQSLGFIAALDGGDTIDPCPPGEADHIRHRVGPGQTYAPTGFYVNIAAATFYARLVGARTLVAGITKDDLRLRPKLGEFLTQWSTLIPLIEEVKREFQPPPRPFEVALPLAELSKAQVVDLGKTLDVQLDATYSCYLGRTLHCGHCEACLARKKAFSGSSLGADPTWYEELPNVGRLKLWGVTSSLKNE